MNGDEYRGLNLSLNDFLSLSFPDIWHYGVAGTQAVGAIATSYVTDKAKAYLAKHGRRMLAELLFTAALAALIYWLLEKKLEVF